MGKGSKFNYIALCICAIACCAWGYVLGLRYYCFIYNGWDLPLYANLMWNLCHGSISTTLFGRSFFIDHFNGIAFLLIPFYYFFQSALTLLYFKLLGFFAGAYVFYLLTAKRLGGPWGIAFMLAYMFYPANVAMLFFEFNFENLALPLIFFIFYFFEEKRFLSFMVSCFLLTIVKENMPLVVFMFGIYGFIERRQDWAHWGLYPLLLGGGMFIGEVFLVIPWVRHGLTTVNGHLGLYARLGHSPTEIVRTFILKEPEVFKILFSGRNRSFLLQLFGPLLITSLLAPLTLLIALPLFLQDLLSQFSGQQSIDFFYASALVVFIFMATIDFLGRINIKFKGFIFGAIKWCIFLAIIGLLFLFDKKPMPRWFERIPSFQEKQAVGQYFLSQIPPDANVLSSYKFLYLLSQRKELYTVFHQFNKFTGQRQKIPDNVDYMIIDFSSKIGEKDCVENFLFQGQWKVLAAADEIVFFRRNASRGEMLIKEGKNPLFLSKALFPVMMLNDALKMEGLDVPVSLKFGQRILRVVFYWEALKSDLNTNLPQISLSILQKDKRFYVKDATPFYGLPLQKGRRYTQVFYYFIPKLSPGNYRVVISSAAPMKQSQQQMDSANVYIKNISVRYPYP